MTPGWRGQKGFAAGDGRGKKGFAPGWRGQKGFAAGDGRGKKGFAPGGAVKTILHPGRRAERHDL